MIFFTSSKRTQKKSCWNQESILFIDNSICIIIIEALCSFANMVTFYMRHVQRKSYFSRLFYSSYANMHNCTCARRGSMDMACTRRVVFPKTTPHRVSPILPQPVWRCEDSLETLFCLFCTCGYSKSFHRHMVCHLPPYRDFACPCRFSQ